MLGCDVARGVITVVLAVAVGDDGLGPLGLAVAGCTMTAFRTLFQPAFQASIPRLVAAPRLVLASLIQRHSPAERIGTNVSVFSTLANIGEAFSAVLAGVLVGMSGLSGGLICNGLLVIAVSGVGSWWLIRGRGSARCGEPVDTP